MTFDRVAVVEDALDALLADLAPAASPLLPGEPLRSGSGLTARRAVELFEDQVLSRQVDRAARELKKTNRSFHTIGGAGHENNAVLGAQLRITDPAFLHYRSGGFMMARARQLPGSTPAFDALLGIVASREDPIAQGRHKVWGSRPLWVPPQTSTIASHLPKAVGMAFSLARARRLGLAEEIPPDAVVMTSFGDATVNHATALAAFNTARYGARIGLPMPILFVCEDNQTGISVPTPEGWIEATFSNQPHLHYRRAGGELDEIWDAVAEAVHVVRAAREPLFLHLDVVRLWGHAGSDAEHAYRSADEITAIEQADPLLRNARRLAASRSRNARPAPRPGRATSASASGLPPRRRPAGRASAPRPRSPPPWRRTTRSGFGLASQSLGWMTTNDAPPSAGRSPRTPPSPRRGPWRATSTRR